MKNEEKVEELVRFHQWNELTEDDKILVTNVLGGEANFNSLKRTLTEMDRLPKSYVSLGAHILPNLQSAFSERHARPSLFFKIISLKAPAYIPAMIALVLVWIYFFRGEKKHVEYISRIQTDTVFLKADTVTVTKVIYRYRKLPAVATPVVTQANTVEEKNFDISVSISMSEKNLDNLLVSGSER
jgi:hypothetical protein